MNQTMQATVNAVGLPCTCLEPHVYACRLECACNCGRLLQAAPILHATLEAAFFALGRAGGNTLNSPYRQEWEKARAVLALVQRPHGRQP